MPEESQPEAPGMNTREQIQIGILIAEQTGLGGEMLEPARKLLAIDEANEVLAAAGKLTLANTELMLDCAKYGNRALEIALNSQDPSQAREAARHAEQASEIATTLHERIADLGKTYLDAYKTIRATIPQLPGPMREKLIDMERNAGRAEQRVEEAGQSARTALDLVEDAAREARAALRRRNME